MVYLDFAATTPIDPSVQDIIVDAQKKYWANPSSPHALGRAARCAIDAARTTVATQLGYKSSECIFTSSGSESIDLALMGVCNTWLQVHGIPGHIITTTVEHKAVIHTVAKLEKLGWSATYLPVSAEGLLDLDVLRNAIREDTALVSIQWVNNETGVMQDICTIASLCKSASVPFHCDAMQAIGHVEFPQNMPDLLSIASHKLYGPKGVGALLVRENIDITAQVLGGGQEFDLRAGTENTSGIVGFAFALKMMCENSKEVESTVRKTSAYLLQQLSALPMVFVNGSREHSVPGIINIHLSDITGETLVMQLDMKGICVSTGSACTTGSSDPSHVLAAMGMGHRKARQNIRVSIGKHTTIEEIDILYEALSECITKV